MREWSHTAEAVIQLTDNIRAKPREWLHAVVAEIRSCGDPEDPVYDEEAYRRELQNLADESERDLADAVILFAEAARTCTDGGHEAYCCPHYCSAHLVSFSPEKEIGVDGPEIGGEG